MRFFYSFFISCVINLLLIFFLVEMGKEEKVRVYKVYKIDLIKMPKEPKIIPKPKKLPQIQKPKEEERPQPQKQQIFLPIEEKPLVEESDEAIPIVKEEPKEIPHIIVPIPQEEPAMIYEPSSLDTPLRLISYIPPKYPIFAKEREIEGKVKLKLLITPDGTVENAEIIEEIPSGFGFSKEALKVVQNYRFSNPTVGGKKVYVYYILPIRFSLE